MGREESERLAREKAVLETQRKLISEEEERTRLQTSARKRGAERRRPEEEVKEPQGEKETEPELEQMKAHELTKEREHVEQAERERELRRRASMETVPCQPDVYARFNEDASSYPFFQVHGSQADLTRTYFGLSRALSPPKISNGKGKDRGLRHLTKSGVDLRALVKEKANSQQQQTGGGRTVVIADESDEQTDSGEDGWTSLEDDSTEVEDITVSNLFPDASVYSQRLSE